MVIPHTTKALAYGRSTLTQNTDGSLRFGELRGKVEGISTKVLTQRLKMLQENGIIDRHHEPTIPPKVTYSLSARGKELSKVLDELCELASQWYDT